MIDTDTIKASFLQCFGSDASPQAIETFLLQQGFNANNPRAKALYIYLINKKSLSILKIF